MTDKERGEAAREYAAVLEEIRGITLGGKPAWGNAYDKAWQRRMELQRRRAELLRLLEAAPDPEM